MFVDLCYSLLSSWLVNAFDPELIDIISSEGSYIDFFLQVIAGPLNEIFLFLNLFGIHAFANLVAYLTDTIT